MAKRNISTIKVAGVYIGTVVGAGFASGQEVLQFFVVFERNGLFGLILVTVMFVFFGYIIMDMGHKLGSKSHIEIIRKTGGKYIGGLIDFIIVFFLFGALTAMIAGSGAMFEENLGIHAIWGNIIMTGATLVTVLTGIKGVVNSISFIVPFLLTSVISVGFVSIFFIPEPIGNIQVAATTSELIQNWLLAAFLYVSYNIVLAVSVLGPLGANAKNKKAIRNGAVLGGLGLGAGAIIIYFALSQNMPRVTGLEIPMIFIAGRIAYAVQIIYAVVLLMEVYSTAVGSLFGFTSRLADIDSKKAKYIITGTSVLALIAAQFGFSNLVKYLYPVVGYGGIILLITLVYSKIKFAYNNR